MKKLGRTAICVIILSVLFTAFPITTNAAPRFNRKTASVKKSTRKKQRTAKLKLMGLSKKAEEETVEICQQ